MIFTDGSCLNNGKANAKCGSGIWIAENHKKNKAIRIPGEVQSNQIGELTAILFISDSKYAIEGLTKNLKTWEDDRWTNIKNADFFKATAYQLRKRSAQMTFEWIKGHLGNEGNEAADSLASKGAEKEIYDQINLKIPIEFDVQGAELSKMTQILAYQNLKNQSQIKQQNTTKRNLEIARYPIQEISKNLETDETIWKECRQKDLQRPIQQFLFKTLHGTHKLGDFWKNIPNYEQRAKCALCNNEIESMAHILTTCQSNERQKIWKMTKNIWLEKYGPWPRITIGTIMGTSRLFRILISESAHLIWTIRCERVIGNKYMSNKTIETRWINKLNTRLTLDRTITSKIDTNIRKLVKTTWSEIISSTTPIPENWVMNPEVLVGIKPSRPSTE
ncbi:ribonuclease H-like protein [Suillus tomentosus]|nr:ribonuclease H-like protein [Suillus tomentosus]